MTLQETLDRIAKSDLPLQGKLDAIRDEFETNIATPAQVAIMHKVNAEQIEGGQADRALKAGDTAPDFTLLDTDGKALRLKDLLAKGPVVLTFYRGVWCPYCNFDLMALEAARSEIEKRGAQLVAVSQQTVVNNRKSQRGNNVGFTIAGDEGGSVADKFGIRWALPEDLKALYTQFGIDLPTFNGEASWTLPMPARYVIDRDGSIAYAEVNPDYRRRPEPSDIFPVLDALKG